MKDLQKKTRKIWYITQQLSVQNKKYQERQIWEGSAEVGKGQQLVKKEMQLKKILGVGKGIRKKIEPGKIPTALKSGTRYLKIKKEKKQKTNKKNPTPVFSFLNCISQSCETIDVFWSGFTRKLGLRHHTTFKDNWANTIPSAGSHTHMHQKSRATTFLHVPWLEESGEKIETPSASPQGKVWSTFPPFTRCLRPPVAKAFPILRARRWSKFSL